MFIAEVGTRRTNTLISVLGSVGIAADGPVSELAFSDSLQKPTAINFGKNYNESPHIVPYTLKPHLLPYLHWKSQNP